MVLAKAMNLLSARRSGPSGTHARSRKINHGGLACRLSREVDVRLWGHRDERPTAPTERSVDPICGQRSGTRMSQAWPSRQAMMANRWRSCIGYLCAIAGPLAFVFGRLSLGATIGDRPLLIVLFIPIVISAYVGGWGAGFTATAMAAFLTDYFLMAPLHTLALDRAVDLSQLIVLIVTGVLTSLLSGALHRASRRAEENHRLQARIVATVPGVIYAFQRRRDGSSFIPYVSPSVEDVFGVTPKEWAKEGSSLFSRLHPDDIAQVRASTAASGRDMTPWRDTFRVRHPIKGEVWVEGRSIPEREADGSICWFGCLQDITEIKNLDERLRRAQKAEVIGQLTGGVAHDFNNLLGVISGNLELLSDGIRDRPELRELAQSAIAAVDRGAVLTRSLLAFARQQPLHPAAVDVNRLVEDLMPMLSRTLGEPIRVHFEPVAPPPICDVDPGQLQSALINLVLNSRDAMLVGGTLTITTAMVDIAPLDASQTELLPGPYVVLAVTDTGAGMTPEVSAKAFDPFFTTKGLAGGSGLGLSMVYGFVKQSRGHVAIESGPGQGTTIKLYLPRHSGSIAAPRQLSVDVAESGHEKILVVEDDKAMNRLVCRFLSAMGYVTCEAVTGAEALDILARDATIALVVTDIVLPGGMSGSQFVEIAASRAPALKFIYMSGYTDNAIAQQSDAATDTPLLQKPFRHTELAKAVWTTLDRSGAKAVLFSSTQETRSG
jgi:PAS domain S-box-containing protein